MLLGCNKYLNIFSIKKTAKMKRTKIKRGRKSILARHYLDSWKYVKESRNFIYAVVIIFLVSFLAGFFVPAPEKITELIKSFIERLLQETEGMNSPELMRFIFLNNLKSSFSGLAFGFFLGIFPIVSAIMNGYLVGFVSILSVKSGGFLVLWRLFPHGIFELPAVFISLGLGLKFGTFIFQKDKKDSFIRYFFSSIKAFALFVVPLLAAAAAIEGSLIFFFG